MNTFKIDKYILNIIRFGAVVPIILFSVLITVMLIEQKNNELKIQIKNMGLKHSQTAA